MRLILALACLSLLLSGCSETVDPQVDDPFKDKRVTAGTDTGVLRGVVVDEALRPLPDVAIEARNAEDAEVPVLTASTDAQGLFVFGDVVPGTYIVKARSDGFLPTQSTTSVVAAVDEPPALRLQLFLDASQQPNLQVHKFSGFIECSFRFYDATGATSAVFGEPYYYGHNTCNALDNQKTNFPVTYEGLPSHIQGELQWRSTQATGSGLTLVAGPEDCRDVKWGRADGEAPLVVPVDNTTLEENVEDGSDSGACFRVFSWVSPNAGDFVGAAISQEFDLVVSVFHNHVPDEGWMFINDGSPL